MSNKIFLTYSSYEVLNDNYQSTLQKNILKILNFYVVFEISQSNN
jgi:hypothetical protein